MSETLAAAHQVVLQLDEPVPPEVPVGSDVVLKVTASCPSRCDLSKGIVRLLAGDAAVAERVIETADFVSAAPKTLGTYAWTILFPTQVVNGVLHEQASQSIAFATRPHGTSLVVWGVPGPVITGERFKVHVGVKSSGACVLSGARIEVLDDACTVVGSGELGDSPWEGTAALYWTEVELVAPVKDGTVSWSARFAPTAGELPHGDSTAQFSFATVKPPDYKLTVKLIEKETDKPIENAHIRLGPFRGLTDRCGMAELALPEGTYEIKVWHAAYEAVPTTIEIATDTVVRLEGVAVPEENPSAPFMMF